MYVCGITPYDATHLGHAATYLAFDLIQRVWRDAGHAVRYVQNVTDVDDPLLERAERTGEDWTHLAVRETDLFRADMAALRVLPPDEFIGAVEAIPEIAVAIEKLLANGAAYRVDDEHPDVYFDIEASGRFGTESHLDRDGDARAVRRARRRPGPARASAIRSTRCCGACAATASRPGTPRSAPVVPAGTSSARSSRSTGSACPSTCRAAGRTSIFPHHEHSAAHAEALTGEAPFAQHYVHAGMIGLDGEKMSKSRGNLVLVSKLRECDVDPMAIRLALLDGHYRAYREWTGGRLPAAEERLACWRAAVARAGGAPARAGARRGARRARRRSRHRARDRGARRVVRRPGPRTTRARRRWSATSPTRCSGSRCSYGSAAAVTLVIAAAASRAPRCRPRRSRQTSSTDWLATRR